MPMAEPGRRGRDAARPAVEPLEGRTVLSISVGVVSPGGTPNFVPQQDGPWSFEISSYYVTPQSGEVDLIVTRPAAQARAATTLKVDTLGSTVQAIAPNAPTPRMTRGILSVGSGPDGRTVERVVRTTGAKRSTLPIVPVAGNYRFAPGQTSLTIPIRLNPRFVPPNGNTDVAVMIYDPTAKKSYSYYSATVRLDIIASFDQIPPKVIGSSRTPGAITLTFSKPMNPATTEDLTNYEVHGPNYVLPPEPLKSAVYDPATQTVTLTPTAPLTQSSYLVRSVNARKAPTDLQGIAAIFSRPAMISL